MPTYDFECKTCNKIIELVLPMKDCTNPQNCKVCDKPMNKLIGVVSFKTDFTIGITKNYVDHYGIDAVRSGSFLDD